MNDIMHWIATSASPDEVFDAITTEEGLASWWTADVEARPEEGSTAVVGFNDRAVVFRMEVTDLVRPELVRWSCEGDFDEWTGTTLEFRIDPAGEGGSEVTFTHAGWKRVDGYFRQCNTDWGRLMYYLKDYLEGRGDGPMMG